MAGDKIQINTYAFYNTATQAPLGGVNLLADILAAFTGGLISNSGGKYNPGNNSTVSSTLSPHVTDFLDNNRPYDNTRPKAFLNWILVDNQFNIVSSSGAMQVVAGSSKHALVAPLLTLPKSGYLYVYVSNESPQDVYFDNLTVSHNAGPLVQEQSFYPYGLQMFAISDKAALKANTPYKYNGGCELEEDGIDYYNTFYRKYDAQIGRFTGVDILAEEMNWLSPYHFGNNNPVIFNDPSGAKYSYMDGQGNKWKHPDILAGTMFAGQAYQEGYGLNGFGDMIGDGFGSGGGGGNSDYGNGPFGDFWKNLTGLIKTGNFYGKKIKSDGHGGWGLWTYEWENGNDAIGGLMGEVTTKPVWESLTSAQSTNVGQPGSWESAIPIWGSGRSAIDHFQNGNIWRGIGYTLLAVSDVLPRRGSCPHEPSYFQILL